MSATPLLGKGNLKYQVILQLVIIIWGATGILGDYINLESISDVFVISQGVVSMKIVFYRTGIAVLSLVFIGLFVKKTRRLSRKEILTLLIVGFIIGLHWITFFYAIKVSTISIGIVCMTLSTLFTSFLEPLFFKRKINFHEILISLLIIVGILIIFGFEFEYYLGIISGVISAFFASLFTVINGRLIKTIPSFKITKIELMGACFVSIIGLLCFGEVDTNLLIVSQENLIYLSILALICTTLAFLISVWVMKFVTPFTVSVSLNMEPIYTIIVAVLLNPVKEKMSLGFYAGGLIILIAIFTNALLKKRARKIKTQ